MRQCIAEKESTNDCLSLAPFRIPLHANLTPPPFPRLVGDTDVLAVAQPPQTATMGYILANTNEQPPNATYWTVIPFGPYLTPFGWADHTDLWRSI